MLHLIKYFGLKSFKLVPRCFDINALASIKLISKITLQQVERHWYGMVCIQLFYQGYQIKSFLRELTYRRGTKKHLINKKKLKKRLVFYIQP